MSGDLKLRSPAASEDDDDILNVSSSDVEIIPRTSSNGVLDQPFLLEDIDSVLNALSDEDEDHDQELRFQEVPVSSVTQEKIQKIEAVLNTSYDLETLRQLALSEGGLINDEIRKKVWPKLLGIQKVSETDLPSQEELESHEEYQQVVLDVNRSLKRFPPGIPYPRRVALQDQLTRLILRVIIKYPHLRYYQGYHDVAVTFLLVVGESVAFKIMEKLSTNHLKDCMEPTMERTSYLLNYIYPLIYRLHPSLFDYLERSEVGTMFCLPWFLTWYGHSINNYLDVVRLYDFFLASPPLMPLYLAAEIVVHRKDDIFAADCDMASMHSVLSQIPDDLPYEELLEKARDLYVQYPPESIEAEVSERSRKGFRPQRGSAAAPHEQLPLHNYNTLWRWLQWNRFVTALPRIAHQAAPRRRYTFLVVPIVTTIVVIYAYCKAAEAYTVDLITSIR